jgi:hypothetical protein
MTALINRNLYYYQDKRQKKELKLMTKWSILKTYINLDKWKKNMI